MVAQQNEAVQRHVAEEKKQEADEQRAEAEKQEAEKLLAKHGIARTQEAEAKRQAEIARQEAEKAVAAKQAEEYEAYIAQIGLANAKINENAYDFALQLLNAAKPELRNWEWGRLTHLCRLGAANYKRGGPVDAVAYSPDGKSIATGDMAGKLTVRDAQTGAVKFDVPHGQYVLSVAYSPDGKQIATGSSDKSIQIVDAATRQEPAIS